jgi:hypothetical protein
MVSGVYFMVSLFFAIRGDLRKTMAGLLFFQQDIFPDLFDQDPVFLCFIR